VRSDGTQPESVAGGGAGAPGGLVSGGGVGGSAGESLTAAKSGGARRAVMLSSFAVRDGDQIYSIGTQHKNLEELIKASGLDWTFLRCGGVGPNTRRRGPACPGQRGRRPPHC